MNPTFLEPPKGSRMPVELLVARAPAPLRFQVAPAPVGRGAQLVPSQSLPVVFWVRFGPK